MLRSSLLVRKTFFCIVEVLFEMKEIVQGVKESLC